MIALQILTLIPRAIVAILVIAVAWPINRIMR